MLLVLGKGGVGRTTTAAMLATAAHHSGLRVLVVAIDGREGLRGLCTTDIDVRAVSAGSALEDYLLDQGFGAFARRLASSGVIEVVGAAAPGIHDLVILGKVKQFAQSGRYDLVILDAPATGHAMSMLSSVDGLLDIVEGGPIRDQARDVERLLRDRDRCGAVVVTLAETTPVNESLELCASLAQLNVSIAGGVIAAVEPMIDFADDAYAAAKGVLAGLHERACDMTADIARFRLGCSAAVRVVDRLPTTELETSDIERLAGRWLIGWVHDA